jgi:hypothetical protein
MIHTQSTDKNCNTDNGDQVKRQLWKAFPHMTSIEVQAMKHSKP